MGTVHQLAPVGANSGDQRIAPRRRVLMRAAIRLQGQEASYALKVRDISSTGLKAHADVNVFVGSIVEVQLPNLGWIPAEVVRADGDLGVGVRFERVIEPEATQTTVTGSYGTAPHASATPSLRRV
jgi:hypothetical protein